MKCSVSGCGKERHSYGMCGMHSQRVIRHGDLSYKSRASSEDIDKALSKGRSCKSNKCLIWPYANANGYGVVNVRGKGTRLVTRIICEDINGPPPTAKSEAAHSCGNGNSGCYNGSHLRWDTPVGNAADKVVHGTIMRGENHVEAKLNDEEVKLIRRLRKRGVFIKEIANRFSISEGLVSMICNRQRWKHLK